MGEPRYTFEHFKLPGLGDPPHVLGVHVVVDVKLVRVLRVFRRVRVSFAPDLQLELEGVLRRALVVQNLLVWRKKGRLLKGRTVTHFDHFARPKTKILQKTCPSK